MNAEGTTYIHTKDAKHGFYDVLFFSGRISLGRWDRDPFEMRKTEMVSRLGVWREADTRSTCRISSTSRLQSTVLAPLFFIYNRRNVAIRHANCLPTGNDSCIITVRSKVIPHVYGSDGSRCGGPHQSQENNGTLSRFSQERKVVPLPAKLVSFINRERAVELFLSISEMQAPPEEGNCRHMLSKQIHS